MSSPASRFRKLEEIFHHASDLEAEERLEYLVAACGEDYDLLHEAQQMLGLDEKAESRLQAAVGSELEQLSRRDVPERVGAYRILELLGQGGLGSVYLAERDDEHFHKRVAIKWLRPEMGSAELERRFRLERQVLAALEHPNIARILDGGTHEGAAYIVMELVQGQSLLDYCRQRPLSIHQKLALFRKICDAVTYAHQNLILHCDLKPSNILVDESGSPKLVDFGIAKALRGSLPTDVGDMAATQTTLGIRPLTPEYASPEQAQYRPLTTSSDIYSLGVVLYELLSGIKPYRITTNNPLQIAEVITKTVVPRPSSRYRRNRADIKRSAPWGSDLDAIVAKAMRKEPEQRYRSVEQFSEDLLHYQENRPVAARRGSWFYHWRKLIRRHRLGAAAIATVVLSLTLATVMTSRQARVADQQRQRAEGNLTLAEEQKDRAEAVIDLLVGLFEVSDPSLAQGSEITAREVLDRGSRRIRAQLDDRPKLRAALAGTIGQVYRKMAILDQAELHLADSLQIRRQEFDQQSLEVVESMHQLARLRIDQNRLAEADELLEQAFELEVVARSCQSTACGDLMRTLALLRIEQGRPHEARGLLAEFLQSPSENEDGVADAKDLLAQVVYDEGDYARAEELVVQGLQAHRQALGGEHPKVLRSLNNLAVIRQSQGDLTGARSALEETLEIGRRVYGDLHGAVALSLHNLAMIQKQENDLDQAERSLDEALTILQAVHDSDNASVADVLHTRAGVEMLREQRDEALTLYRRALEIRRRRLSPGHPDIVHSLLGLADLLRREDTGEAEALYREAVALQRANPKPHGHYRAYPLERLGALICRQAPEEAVELLREALRVRRQSPAAEHWHTDRGEARLGRCLVGLDTPLAIEIIKRALGNLEAKRGVEDPETLKVKQWLERARSFSRSN